MGRPSSKARRTFAAGAPRLVVIGEQGIAQLSVGIRPIGAGDHRQSPEEVSGISNASTLINDSPRLAAADIYRLKLGARNDASFGDDLGEPVEDQIAEMQIDRAFHGVSVPLARHE